MHLARELLRLLLETIACFLFYFRINILVLKTAGPLMYSKIAIVLLVLFLGSFDFLSAETWPTWRGPNGNGFTPETKTPVTWD
ncbi:MAG: hypothetical protein ACK56I_17415, partial [bacterium]